MLLDSAWNGFSSFLAARFLFSRCRQRANAAGRTGESCLLPRALRRGFGEVEPASLTQPFPSCLGLSSRPPDPNFVRIRPVSVLSMNWHHLTRKASADNGLLSTALFTAGALRRKWETPNQANEDGRIRVFIEHVIHHSNNVKRQPVDKFLKGAFENWVERMEWNGRLARSVGRVARRHRPVAHCH